MFVSHAFTMTTVSVFCLLLFASCLSWVCGATDIAKPCNTSSSTSLSFTIISRKNKTGHWIAEVKMGPEITDGQHNGGWQIHVDKNIVNNNGPEPIVQIKATITAPPPIASPGYEFFPGHGYYKLHTESKNWEDAKAACYKEHAHLAIINSEGEANVIKQLLERYPTLGGPHVAAFIGFNDIGTEGQYVTIFGEPLSATGFTRWSDIGKQPDNDGKGEDCGSVHRNGGLNDFACDNPAPFICEQDLYPPSNVHTLDPNHQITTTGQSAQHPDIDIRLDNEEPPQTKHEEPIIIDEVPAE